MDQSVQVESAPPPWQPIVAYTLPLALFMVGTSIEGLESVREYFPWLYMAKMAIVFASWVMLRRWYPPLQLSAASAGIAVLVGAVGFLIWVGLIQVQNALTLPDWLSVGDRVGYDPFTEIESVPLRSAFLAVRLFGLILVVPLIEEVVWRGFLIRWLIDEDFQSVELGKATPFGFAAVTVLFTVAHPELLAAAVWCATINLLWMKTRSLWTCIVAHATTNAVLGVYILATKSWSLW